MQFSFRPPLVEHNDLLVAIDTGGDHIQKSYQASCTEVG